MNQLQEEGKRRKRGGREEERAGLEEKCCLGQFLCRSLEDAIFAADWSKSDRGRPWGEWGEPRIMNTLPFSHKRLTCAMLTSEPERHLCVTGERYLISCGSASPLFLVTSVTRLLSLQGGPFFLWGVQYSPRMPPSLLLPSLLSWLLLCSALLHPNHLFLIPK